MDGKRQRSGGKGRMWSCVCVCVWEEWRLEKANKVTESESIAKQAKSENKPFLFDFWSIFQKWRKKVSLNVMPFNLD